MTEADLGGVNAVADAVHVDYPEDPAVFAERLSLYPSGCWVLADGSSVVGYVVSHPWYFAVLPALNSALGGLPADANTFYIHDIALLPGTRGSGHSSAIVRRLLAHSDEAGFVTASLVAVNRSVPYWERHGFSVVDDPVLREKLLTYDDEARFMTRTLR